MTTNLFNEFQAISSKQWKQKSQFELNGADYNETLIWNSPEGINVKPFYHFDEFEAPFSYNTKAKNFKICQNIFVFDENKSLKKALKTLSRGAESLRFTIENDSVNIIQILEKLPLESITVYFNFNFLSVDYIEKIENFVKNKKQNYSTILTRSDI